jgi:hypothetical protein
MAPMAISHHLKMLSSIPPVNDSSLVLNNMPVLFTSTKSYSASKRLFDEAIYASILFAIPLEEILTANHLFSSQQFLVYHLHSKGIHNKMHRQQFLHVIGQGC